MCVQLRISLFRYQKQCTINWRRSQMWPGTFTLISFSLSCTKYRYALRACTHEGEHTSGALQAEYHDNDIAAAKHCDSSSLAVARAERWQQGGAASCVG